MRERPRLTIRRSRGGAPYFRGPSSGMTEPRLISPHNTSNITGTGINTHSRSPRSLPVNGIHSYWKRIAGIAKETFSGLLHFSNSVPTNQNMSTAGEVVGASSLPHQGSPSVHEVPTNTGSSAVEASRRGYQSVDTSLTVPERPTTLHETTFPDASPPSQPMPSQSLSIPLQSTPQIIYNFYYMNGGIPTSLPVAPTQSLQPEFITRSSPAWNRASILARRPVALKRERERQDVLAPVGRMSHLERFAVSSAHPINDSGNTFPSSNISYRTSLNTSFSGETTAKRVPTDNYIMQDTRNKKINASIEKKTMEKMPPSSGQGPNQGIVRSGGFVRSGPPAVIPEDDGFAPNAGSDDEGPKKPSIASAPPKPFSLGTGSLSAKPAPGTGPNSAPVAPSNPFSFGNSSGGAAPADKPAAPSNPFSFGNNSGGAAPADKPAAPSNSFGVVVSKGLTVQGGNSAGSGGFVRSGPPAVIPEDDGFAPNAGSDDEGPKKPSIASAPPKPFSLGTGSLPAKPAPGTGPNSAPVAPSNPFSFGNNSGGAAPADKPAAPSNPFSFGNNSGGAAPADKPAAPSNSFGVVVSKGLTVQGGNSAGSGGFVRSGPPAVIPEDDGFAPNAGSDDEGPKKPSIASAPPKPFSLGTGSLPAKPAPGTGPNSAPVAPSNPFSFGNSSGGAAPADKPAAPSNPFSFGNSSGGAAPADKPAAPSNPFSFGNSSGGAAPADKPAAPSKTFSFGNSSGGAAPADKPTAPSNPFSFGNSSGGAAPADKPAAPSNPFSFGNSSGGAAPADKPAAPSKTFSFGNSSSGGVFSKNLFGSSAPDGVFKSSLGK
ncbi:Nucleoporin NUP98 [Trypanosoma cruzi]|nr:Nucleoporin NUP98 [Trypanosoma cruzi]